MRATVSRVLTALSRHRRLALTTGLVGVAIVGALVWPGFLTRQDGTVATTPPPSGGRAPTSTQSPNTSKPAPFDWAMSLPRGADVRATFVLPDNTLYSGATTFSLPANYGGVLAKVPSGWLVAMSNSQSKPGRFGLLSPQGEFRAFPDYGTGWARERVVSPDGTEVASETSVIEIENGRQVSRLPANASILESWTRVGILYQDRRREHWLWRPGSPPISLPESYFDSDVGVLPFNADGLGIWEDQNGCSTVMRLEADADLSPVMTTCKANISYVSPTGHRTLAQDGTIIAIPSGDIVTSMKPPEGWPAVPREVGIAWEDEDNLLLTIRGEPVFRWPTVLVRCTISTNSCERASDVLRDSSGSIEPVPFG